MANLEDKRCIMEVPAHIGGGTVVVYLVARPFHGYDVQIRIREEGFQFTRIHHVPFSHSQQNEALAEYLLCCKVVGEEVVKARREAQELKAARFSYMYGRGGGRHVK